MLRTLLLIVALAVGAVGLVARLAGHHGATPFAIWGGVIAVAVMVERWRYRGASDSADWQATPERFVDPESGRTLQVLYNPRTGERRYEPVDGGPA